ncbi:MAG: cysteine desulfurase [Myxococcales bacterium]|nr:MAG: cysteine desulfurase [Myxococcales bacterium]
MSDEKIFMDHVSTTPCDPRVVEAMRPYFSERYGNPSSQIHEQGVLASKAIDQAREQVAGLVNAAPKGVVFTSGATEANNLAMFGLAGIRGKEYRRILISEVEHYSIYYTMEPLRAHGYEVETVPVDKTGLVRPEALAKKLRPDTALVSIQHANGEIGAVQPLAELAALAHAQGALFHSDAAVSAGLVPLDMKAFGIDALTLSAHNFYGPKGVGALVLADGLRPRPRAYGGWQEGGLRSGTENVPGIVGMGMAAQIAKAELADTASRLETLARRLRDGIASRIRFVHFTGDRERRLPGHVSFWVEHVEGESLILFLNARGIMAASGSACSSNLKAHDEEELVASHVLAAVGVPTDICAGSVCLSLGKQNTEEDVERLLGELPATVDRLLMMSPSYADYLKQQKHR